MTDISATGRLSANARGALLMMASMVAFTLNDTCVKLTLADLPLFQVITIRGAIASTLIFVLAWRLGALDFRFPRADLGLVGLRSLSEIGATWFFLTALSKMPLANVSAILQVLPLSVTLGAAMFFGERVGWRRVLAIVIGFAGMLLIVRPGPEGFNLYVLYALGAVVCVTLRDLATRRMSGRVQSLSVTLVASVTVFLFAAVSSTAVDWAPVDARQIALIAGAGIFIMGGYHFSIAVMRVGEVSAIAPFRYTSLLAALVLGWLVFGDWPDAVTLAGAAIVVASGLFTFWRERRLASA